MFSIQIFLATIIENYIYFDLMMVHISHWGLVGSSESEEQIKSALKVWKQRIFTVKKWKNKFVRRSLANFVIWISIYSLEFVGQWSYNFIPLLLLAWGH